MGVLAGDLDLDCIYIVLLKQLKQSLNVLHVDQKKKNSDIHSGFI